MLERCNLTSRSYAYGHIIHTYCDFDGLYSLHHPIMDFPSSNLHQNLTAVKTNAAVQYQHHGLLVVISWIGIG